MSGGPQASVPDQAVLLALASAATLVDAWDPGTRHHLERVATLGLRFAAEVAPELVGDRGFVLGMLLHDVGKIALPRSLFTRRGPLRPEDWFHIWSHPLEGAALVGAIPFLHPAVPVIRWHHEHWNGQGYPDGLAGEAIPVAARVFALCDAYDSMRSPRPYRRALSREEARQRIEQEAGTHFDPRLARAFLHLERELPEPPAEPPHGEESQELARLLSRLSVRRWQVLALSAAGVDRAETARLLGLSVHEITNYRVSLRRRLELDSPPSFPDALRARLYPLLEQAAPALSALLHVVETDRPAAGDPTREEAVTLP